jgi:ABC-type glutathione transport system ATPase component
MNHTPTHNPTEAARASGPILSVHGVSVAYGRRRVLAGVSLEMRPAETLGIVGESGSGKSTLALAILGLTALSEGRIEFAGIDFARAGSRALRRARRDMQVIFQDPGASLNPRMVVGEIIAEPLVVHDEYARAASAMPRREWLAMRVSELLISCGLPPDAAARHPRQFSGGQKQRIAIARAIALRPKLLICDEPTSALDVSVQAQIINLLMDIRAEHGVAYLFISHDLAVVSHVCRRIAVMREGRIVEQGETDSVLRAPGHAYTRELLAAAGAPS